MDLLKNTPINLTVYGFAVLGTIVGGSMDNSTLVLACKPLMMIVLGSWFYFNSRRVGDRFTLLIQAGLFFSLIGDVALIFQEQDEFNFLIGLAAFLIAHTTSALSASFSARSRVSSRLSRVIFRCIRS